MIRVGEAARRNGRGLGLRVRLLGGSWDLATIYNWGYNPTYNWGNPYEAI